MGDYWDYRATKKKPVIFGKKIQNRNGYPFFVLFLVKNIGFLVAHLSGRQAKCPYIMGPILPAGLEVQLKFTEV